MSTDAAVTTSTRYDPPNDQPSTSSAAPTETVGLNTLTASVSVYAVVSNEACTLAPRAFDFGGAGFSASDASDLPESVLVSFEPCSCCDAGFGSSSSSSSSRYTFSGWTAFLAAVFFVVLALFAATATSPCDRRPMVRRAA